VFTTTGKNPINGMMRINTLAHFLRQLKRFSLFVVGVTLLSLTFPILAAQESEEVADHIIAAEEALKTNQYQTAAAEYRLAAELSDDVEVARTATQVAYSYGFNDDAVRSAERWVELEPDSDEALLYVAQLYLRTGEIRDSRRSFEKLLEKGEQPVDESLLRLIPVLAREDADNAFELMRQLARPYKDSPFARLVRQKLPVSEPGKRSR
jgi:tetratricopeptide (TPR) repeat protein